MTGAFWSSCARADGRLPRRPKPDRWPVLCFRTPLIPDDLATRGEFGAELAPGSKIIFEEVMREQTEHLIELADSSSHVTIQVLPTEAGVHAGIAGPFVIMDFAEPAGPIVYLETYTDGLYL